jgi:hypothetical protein
VDTDPSWEWSLKGRAAERAPKYKGDGHLTSTPITIQPGVASFDAGYADEANHAPAVLKHQAGFCLVRDRRDQTTV